MPTASSEKKFDPRAPLRHLTRGRKEIFKFHPSDIYVKPGFNSRTHFTGLEELARSMFEHGQENPLTVRPTGDPDRPMELVDGERRWRAANIINEQFDPEWTLECKIKPKTVPTVDLLISQLLSNEGVPFTPLEKARLVRRILAEDDSLKPADVARLVGESKQAISDQLALVDHAAPELIEFVEADTLAASTAVKIVRMAPEDHMKQMDIFESAREAAAAAGRETIFPRDLPEKPAADPSSSSSDSFVATPQTNDPESSPSSDNGPSTTDNGQEDDDTEPPVTIVDGTAESSPETPASEDTETPSAPDPGAIERIKNADNTNRDGSKTGPGNEGGYIKPDKQIKKINKLLEDLSEKGTGNKNRILTTEIILRVIHNESSITDLRNHLTK